MNSINIVQTDVSFSFESSVCANKYNEIFLHVLPSI